MSFRQLYKSKFPGEHQPHEASFPTNGIRAIDD